MIEQVVENSEEKMPNGIFVIPGSHYDFDFPQLISRIEKRYGKIHSYVCLDDREPTLYLPTEKRCLVGLDVLRSEYEN